MTREDARAYFIDSNERIISVAKDENSYNYKTQQIEDVFMRRTFEANEWAIKALEQEPCGDAISRQAVIEIIKSMPNDNPSYWNSCDVINRENILDEIEDLPSVTPQTRWIPVSERLPEKRGTYLVTQKAIFPGHVFRRIVCYAPNLHNVNEYDFKGKKRAGWYEYDSEWGYWELEDVIAWMPLPEPYKAESEDKE